MEKKQKSLTDFFKKIPNACKEFSVPEFVMQDRMSGGCLSSINSYGPSPYYAQPTAHRASLSNTSSHSSTSNLQRIDGNQHSAKLMPSYSTDSTGSYSSHNHQQFRTMRPAISADSIQSILSSSGSASMAIFNNDIPKLTAFPTNAISSQIFLNLMTLHEFLTAFSAPLFEDAFTYDLGMPSVSVLTRLVQFTDLFYNPEKSLEAIHIFCNVCTYTDLLQIIPDFVSSNQARKKKLPLIDTEAFLQRELEGIFHSTEFTNKTKEELQELSNVFGGMEWIKIHPFTLMEALRILLEYLTESDEYLQFIHDAAEEINTERKDRWQRNAKKKETMTAIDRLDKEIVSFNQELARIPVRYHAENENMINSGKTGMSKDLIKKRDKEIKLKEQERNAIVAIFNKQQAFHSKLLKEEEAGLDASAINEKCMRSTQRCMLGVDRNGTYYWWIHATSKDSPIYTIISEESSEITCISTHAQLISLLKSLTDQDINEANLKRAIIDKFRHIDSALNLIAFRTPAFIATHEPALKNTVALESFIHWVGTLTTKESNTGAYFTLFEKTLSQLLERCVDVFKQLYLKQHLPFREHYNQDILKSNNVEKITNSLDIFFSLIEEAMEDVSFTKVFQEYDQLKSVQILSDLCEWMYEFEKKLVKFEKTVKAKQGRPSVETLSGRRVVAVNRNIEKSHPRQRQTTRLIKKKKLTEYHSESESDENDEESDGDESSNDSIKENRARRASLRDDASENGSRKRSQRLRL